MSNRGAGASGDQPAEESFLARWSRRKAEMRVEGAATDLSTTEASAVPATTPQSTAARDTATQAASARDPEPPDAAPSAEEHTKAPATTVTLPDLDMLDQDADYSAFLSPGVDANLRRRALRKLFHSPKFNTFDGLDTYRDDYTSFPALGEVVTADMRHHLERLAERLVAEAEAPSTESRTSPRPLPAAGATVAVAAEASEPTRSATPADPAASPQDDDGTRDPA